MWWLWRLWTYPLLVPPPFCHIAPLPSLAPPPGQTPPPSLPAHSFPARNPSHWLREAPIFWERGSLGGFGETPIASLLLLLDYWGWLRLGSSGEGHVISGFYLFEFSPKMQILTCWFQKPIRLVSPPEDIAGSLFSLSLVTNITFQTFFLEMSFSVSTGCWCESSLHLISLELWLSGLLTWSSCSTGALLGSHYQSQVCLKMTKSPLEWSLYWESKKWLKNVNFFNRL